MHQIYYNRSTETFWVSDQKISKCQRHKRIGQCEDHGEALEWCSNLQKAITNGKAPGLCDWLKECEELADAEQ